MKYLFALLIALSLLLPACGQPDGMAATPAPAATPEEEPAFTDARKRMVEYQIERRGISSPEILAAMAAVPRHKFVPQMYLDEAYADHPLPIGHGQTISQPYVVALMTEHLALQRSEKVLEVGTGSGYQAAVLAEISDQVYSIEIIEPLGHRRQIR